MLSARHVGDLDIQGRVLVALLSNCRPFNFFNLADFDKRENTMYTKYLKYVLSQELVTLIKA